MLPQAIADLQRSGISSEDAARAGIFDTADASTIYPDFDPAPAIVLPYYEPDRQTLMTFDRDGQQRPFCRVRYLDPPKAAGGFTGPQKAQRYAQPGASGTRVYFCPLLEWDRILKDSAEPVIITEGEKKALAAAKHGLPVIGLGGVWNFGSGLIELLPELEAAKWRGRDTYIVFDSDAANNPGILAAEARLVHELGTKRGARCFIVRLPPAGDKKVGLDDFLLSHGADALVKLLEQSPCLGALDAKVLELNQSVAWVEREGMVYDIETDSFIRKDHFVNGSRFSAITHVTMGGKKRTTPQKVTVAQVWLTHPHAQRYSEILFRPGQPRTVETNNGRLALNFWSGWRAERGIPESDRRVAAFLALSRHLFRNMPPEHRDLPVKLMAYKAQHPMEKVPMAMVFIGDQGCGKSLWGECIKAAFGPYSTSLKSVSFGAQFQNWLEKTVFVTVDEAEREHLDQYGDQLKSLISGVKVRMNDKFRPEREIDSYTMYLLTANDRAVGSYSSDDRRMLVVHCPAKLSDTTLYDYLGERGGQWFPEHGPQALMGWLLDYDLKGWRPPAEPPMTSEKYMAYREGLTSVQALAEEMQTANGSRVVQWIAAAKAWAQDAELNGNPQLAGQARAISLAADRFPVRDWYTPEELLLLFPNVMHLNLHTKFKNTTAPGELSRQLRNAGVPYLTNKDDPRGFRFGGLLKQFLVIANFADWTAPISQDEFDRLVKNCPSYGTYVARQRT